MLAHTIRADAGIVNQLPADQFAEDSSDAQRLRDAGALRLPSPRANALHRSLALAKAAAVVARRCLDHHVENHGHGGAVYAWPASSILANERGVQEEKIGLSFSPRSPGQLEQNAIWWLSGGSDFFESA
jgi:hypothetical protein